MLPNLMLARGCVNPRPAANHAVTGIERSRFAGAGAADFTTAVAGFRRAARLARTERVNYAVSVIIYGVVEKQTWAVNCLLLRRRTQLIH